MPSPNRYAEAFKESFNLVSLGTAAAVSAAMLNPLPLLVCAVAEAAYLLFIPDSRWYDARLSVRCDAEVVRMREQLKAQVLPLLRPEMEQRFTRLEQTRAQIDTQTLVGQKWFREVLRKLDYLLEKFLVFASKEVQFRSYLRSVLQEVREATPGLTSPQRPQRLRIPLQPPPPPVADNLPSDPDERWTAMTVREIQTAYDRELEEIRGLAQREQDPETKAVMEKREDVLRRRHEYVGKIGKILSNLNHQLKLLEDTFGLINDEIRARSPEQVLADIEDVVWQTDTMTKLLEEIAPYEQVRA